MRALAFEQHTFFSRSVSALPTRIAPALASINSTPSGQAVGPALVSLEEYSQIAYNRTSTKIEEHRSLLFIAILVSVIVVSSLLLEARIILLAAVWTQDIVDDSGILVFIGCGCDMLFAGTVVFRFMFVIII